MTAPATLLDLSQACFQAVGPSRISICALGLLGEAEETGADVRQRYEIEKERLAVAEQMLSSDFTDGLLALGHTPSAKLTDAHQAAHMCLATVMQALDGPVAVFVQTLGADRPFYDYFFDVAEPEISAFLKCMTTELLHAHRTTEEARRTETMRTVRDANTVSRSITLIAINAAIEASRSDNKGFKVIADEIKLLAARTESLLGDVAEQMQRH